jgi:hypothetical protein
MGEGRYTKNNEVRKQGKFFNHKNYTFFYKKNVFMFRHNASMERDGLTFTRPLWPSRYPRGKVNLLMTELQGTWTTLSVSDKFILAQELRSRTNQKTPCFMVLWTYTHTTIYFAHAESSVTIKHFLISPVKCLALIWTKFGLLIT